MTTPYFEKYIGRIPPTHCPGCGGAFPLADFRKWWGAKRMLRSLCIRCEPNLPLSLMTPEQRANAVAWERPGASLERIQAMNTRELEARSRRASAMMRKVKHSQRLRNWTVAILRRIRTERDWARKNLDNGPFSDEWERFFEAYLRVLRDMQARIEQHARVRSAAPLTPTPEQTNPRTWVHEETLGKLRELYSACPVIRGRRMYRDPEFLSW